MHALFLPEHTLFQFCPGIYSLNRKMIISASFRVGWVNSFEFEGGHLVDKYGKVALLF